MITPSQLRTDFPEFSDATVYTDAMIQFWLDFATKLLSPDRWGALLDHGIELLTAHSLVLSHSAMGADGSTGGLTGLVNNKAVGSVSVGYDASSITLPNAANYNLTYYGRQYMYLVRLIGVGAYQV